MDRPVDRQRVADEVVVQLRTRILTGAYAPGAKLPPERELSRTMGVNRASLREALKKLEHLGLVRIRQGDGTRVKDFMESGGIELVQHLLPLAGDARPALVRDMLEFRRLFGREAARLAAVRASPRALERLEELADRADRAADATALFDADFEFYVALTQAAGNQVMGLLINTVRDSARAYLPVLSNLAPDAAAVRAHHRALLAALRAGDHAGAARVADAYLAQGVALAARLGGAELAPLPTPPLA